MEKAQIVSIVISTAILLGVFELVRNGRLREAYSVLWIFTAVAMILVAVFKEFVVYLGGLVGVSYSLSVLFLLAFVLLILINIQFSLIISMLTERNKVLMQEMAMVRQRVDELEKKTAS